jgi:hypothetical protein
MATAAYPDVSASGRLVHERRLQQCAMRARGRQQHVAPLAQSMAEKPLVRARGDAGAPLRHLDLDVLREALRRLLRHESEDPALTTLSHGGLR